MFVLLLAKNPRCSFILLVRRTSSLLTASKGKLTITYTPSPLQTCRTPKSGRKTKDISPAHSPLSSSPTPHPMISPPKVMPIDVTSIYHFFSNSIKHSPIAQPDKPSGRICAADVVGADIVDVGVGVGDVNVQACWRSRITDMGGHTDAGIDDAWPVAAPVAAPVAVVSGDGSDAGGEAFDDRAQYFCVLPRHRSAR